VRHSRIEIVAMVVAALVLASVGGGAVPDTRIAGVAESCGGHALFLQHPHCTPLEGSASIWGAKYKIDATRPLARGHFSFAVLPGRYKLTLTVGGYQVVQSVDAVAHKTTKLEFDSSAATY
jgi:hypothetical protein